MTITVAGQTCPRDCAMTVTMDNANLMMLITARRMMITAERDTARRAGKAVEAASAREAMEEDEALLSGNVDGVKPPPPKAEEPVNVDVKLSDLIGRLKELREGAPSSTSRESVSVTATVVETEVTMEFEVFAPVNGLARRDQSLAETDRYRFEFSNGTTFKITDKWSGKSTTIWGDPHVDTSDEEGEYNGEFSDLKASDTHTTLLLQDGTRVTFTARDQGVIEAVDIFKGDQHLRGVGSASAEREHKQLFADEVDDDAASVSGGLARGDVVRAGGDGNDWFDEAGRLVWGKQTGFAPMARSYATLSVQMRQSVTQFSFAQSIDRWI